MGLSSSQARLLNLTARMHQIEYKAAKLEAQKLQMANESNKVYEEYLNVLDAAKVQLKTITQDGSTSYIDATYNNLIAAGYTVRYSGYGGLLVDEATKNNYVAANGNKNYFIALQTGRAAVIDGYTEIYTADQLIAALGTNSTNQKYRLMSNIDMSGKAFTASNFTNSELDGNGYSITGLNQNLFNTITGSTISNLSLNANISNTTSTGILANTITGNSTIEDIVLSGTLKNTGIVNVIGALAGTIGTDATISRVQSSASVIAENSLQVGGLVGSSNGTLENCSVQNAEITGRAIVGGLVADASGTITNSEVKNSTITAAGNMSDSSNDSMIGGFAARITGTVENCQSLNNSVNALYRVVGGFVGSSYGTVTNCISTSNVTVDCSSLSIALDPMKHTGEFSGMLGGGTIENCSSSGSVQAKGTSDTDFVSLDYFTGIYNGLPNTTTITNCYNGETDVADFVDATNYVTLNNSPAATSSTTAITVTPPSIVCNVDIAAENPVEAALFDDMTTEGYYVGDLPHLGHEDDTVWLSNMIEAGMLFLYKKDNDGENYQISVSTDTGLREVSDETNLKKAEAKYEADMKQIDLKDRKYDTDLAALETERSAIKEEIETLKTVAKENVERTFKLFS